MFKYMLHVCIAMMLLHQSVSADLKCKLFGCCPEKELFNKQKMLTEQEQEVLSDTFVVAAKKKDYGLIKKILRKGYIPRNQDFNYITDVCVARYILENSDFKPMCHTLKYAKNKKIAELLYQHGATVDCLDVGNLVREDEASWKIRFAHEKGLKVQNGKEPYFQLARSRRGVNIQDLKALKESGYSLLYNNQGETLREVLIKEKIKYCLVGVETFTGDWRTESSKEYNEVINWLTVQLAQEKSLILSEL